MRRRLLLARALMHEPRLVILDEPTAGVDFELRLELWSYIRRLHDEGTTILLTTHYLEEAEELCEEIALIRGGRPARARQRARAARRLRRADSLADVYVKAMASEHRADARWPGARCCASSSCGRRRSLAPVVSSFLFILVFGLSLGGRIKQIDGVDVRGLHRARPDHDGDGAGRLLQQLGVGLPGARFDRYINDVLAAPMRAWEVNLGLSLGGVVRALLIGVSLPALAIPVTSTCRCASRSCWCSRWRWPSCCSRRSA